MQPFNVDKHQKCAIIISEDGERMKKRIAALLSGTMLLCCSCRTEPEKSFGTFFAMNTYMNVTLYGENSEEVMKSINDKINELESLWSVTDSESDIYKLNNANGNVVSVNGYTSDIADFSLSMAEFTNGAFNPAIYPVLSAWGFTTGENRVPPKSEIDMLLKNTDYNKIKKNGMSIQLEEGMSLDFGAVAKGYTADVLKNLIYEQGVTSALLDLGGNIQAIGKKPDGTDWEIGLRSPFSDDLLGTLSVSDKSVVTSGNYERYFIDENGKAYGHIINPDTGYPVDNDLASVTIIRDEGKICDVLSTALFVMGYEQAVAFYEQNKNFDMIIVHKDGTVYITEGVSEIFMSDFKIKII